MKEERKQVQGGRKREGTEGLEKERKGGMGEKEGESGKEKDYRKEEAKRSEGERGEIRGTWAGGRGRREKEVD